MGSATLILTIFHQSNLLRLSFPPTLSFFMALNNRETQKNLLFAQLLRNPLNKCNGGEDQKCCQHQLNLIYVRKN